MKTALLFAAVVTAGAIVVSSGCSSDKPNPLTATPADGGTGSEGGITTTPPAPLADPAVPCSDALDAIYADPGALGADPTGSIIKCNKGDDLTKESMQADLDRIGYKGKAITSGAHVYRILYKTTRGDTAHSAGYSSAIVYVPIVQANDTLPVIVASRGSRGQAERCAVSKLDPSLSTPADALNDEALLLAYPIVGSGLAVILPDLAGYAGFGAAGNPPSAYAQAEDVGRSTLDGSRAIKKLYPQLGAKTVILGHSQGGHTALSALALADTYGVEGTLVGVAVYSPLWLSQRSWGAIIDVGVANDRGFTFAAQTDASAVSVWYHYTQAELLDGPGEGVKLFAADKQATVKQFVEQACWGEYTTLTSNATYAYELFDPAFTTSVGDPAAGLSSCGATDTVCQKWLSRYSNDRPHLTGNAAKLPIFLLYGGMDTTIPPSRMSCALDRLKQDQTNLTVCFEAAAAHTSIISYDGERVVDWIGSLTIGWPAPAACAQDASAVTATCSTPPPND